MATKTVEEWERIKGYIIPDVKLLEKMTEKEFDILSFERGLGVNYPDRIKFLQDNGYEITRENLVNSSLSAI